MSNTIDLALMAGASYVSNRDEKNRFTIPDGWRKVSIPDSYVSNLASGFEAISFFKGSEIVISFAGTDFDNKIADFFYGNTPLAAGLLASVGRTR